MWQNVRKLSQSTVHVSCEERFNFFFYFSVNSSAVLINFQLRYNIAVVTLLQNTSSNYDITECLRYLQYYPYYYLCKSIHSLKTTYKMIFLLS